MRRSDREITSESGVRDILDEGRIMHLGLFDDAYPYVVPLHYGYEYADGKLTLYAHSARAGHKLDLIERSYNLEVSSPGLDRELIKDTDFVRFTGREVEVKTYGQIDGSKNFEGTLIGKEGDTVIIDKAGKRLEIPSDKISKINLAIVF